MILDISISSSSVSTPTDCGTINELIYVNIFAIILGSIVHCLLRHLHNSTYVVTLYTSQCLAFLVRTIAVLIRQVPRLALDNDSWRGAGGGGLLVSLTFFSYGNTPGGTESLRGSLAESLHCSTN